MITAKTIPIYLLGNPVKHSWSPIFQNAGLKHLDIDSVYLALHIEKEDFDTVVAGLKKINLLGLNITLPYKKNIMKFTDELSDDAKKIDAVNTVECLNGKWIGHNTDWYGVYKTLEEKKIDKDQNILLIGAGGATPGVIYGLQKYGINNLTITNRTMSKAEKLAKQFEINLINIEKYKDKLNDYSMIVNCTSIDFSNVLDNFNDEKIYFDLKYYKGRIKTKNYIDGKNMLIYQGSMAFSIWTKKDAPVSIMKKVLNKYKK